MLAYGVADPAQLAILTKALNDYCAKHRIICEQERERIAIKVMSLFGRGVDDPDQLATELERAG
ncbi:MAG: hypothetical protein E5X48_14450 [Mesorhizobium sp.]|uniref:hypothetical protein n=1 Tax=Mesorhizobium sp. TaxID=1871066 RepID=UPI001221264B|nr:hypothetical protein [Mesorhizobium sp.]TIQ35243.1 MAG: hypothetical protein E5X48_14450 [Mesorhizobium sp.]